MHNWIKCVPLSAMSPDMKHMRRVESGLEETHSYSICRDFSKHRSVCCPLWCCSSTVISHATWNNFRHIIVGAMLNYLLYLSSFFQTVLCPPSLLPNPQTDESLAYMTLHALNRLYSLDLSLVYESVSSFVSSLSINYWTLTFSPKCRHLCPSCVACNLMASTRFLII